VDRIKYVSKRFVIFISPSTPLQERINIVILAVTFLNFSAIQWYIHNYRSIDGLEDCELQPFSYIKAIAGTSNFMNVMNFTNSYAIKTENYK
jgi:hypothetical protein